MAESAGIVVFNRDNNTVLIGNGNNGYDITSYGNPNKTIQNFFMQFAARNIIALAPPPVLPGGHAPGTNLRTVPGGAWNYVQQLFPLAALNPFRGPERHLVDAGIGAYVTQISARNSAGYPKGKEEIRDADILTTAIREFNEETGYDFTPSRADMIDVGVHSNYQFYFIEIDNARAQQILDAYYGVAGRRYNSELFNLRFVNTNAGLNLDDSSAAVTTHLVGQGRLPGGGAGFAGGSYYNKYQKYQNKLLTR